jgi:hypothetical protein
MPIPPFSWTKALQEVSQIKVKSITDPIFKFALITLAIGASAATFVPLWVSIFIFSIAGLLSLLGIGFYCYFAFKDPNYLRSETFQLQMKSFEFMGDKENLMPNSQIKQLINTTDPSPKDKDVNNNSNGS